MTLHDAIEPADDFTDFVYDEITDPYVIGLLGKDRYTVMREVTRVLRTHWVEVIEHLGGQLVGWFNAEHMSVYPPVDAYKSPLWPAAFVFPQETTPTPTGYTPAQLLTTQPHVEIPPGEVVEVVPAEPEPSKVPSLVEALQRSLDRAMGVPQDTDQ